MGLHASASSNGCWPNDNSDAKMIFVHWIAVPQPKWESVALLVSHEFAITLRKLRIDW